MGDDSSQRIQELFLGALDVAPQERKSWLIQNCDGDEQLFNEVMTLLSHDNPSHDPLERGLDLNPDSSRHLDASKPKGDTATQPERNNGDSADEKELTKFDDYEIIEEIARGGMGVVYKAHQTSLNRVVALKMILAGKRAGNEQVQRFLSEAKAAAKMDHPGIVPVYEIGQHGDQHYFSMAFVEGQSLADKAQNKPLPPKESAQLIKVVAQAIAYAHQQGVIHRDLKPANVLVDTNGQPKVSDFGLAKQVESELDMTQTGAVLGTPSFMSPEQAAGKNSQVGALSDVYSLGAVFYFLLTGRPPFQASTVPDTLRQVFYFDPVSIRKLNPSVPKDLETICLKALAKDPGRRYGSASELAEDVDRWLTNKPILARRVGPMERGWIAVKRQPMISGLIAAIVLFLCVGSFVFWDRQNAAHAEGLVLALSTAGTNEIDEIVKEINAYDRWTGSLLASTFQDSKHGSKAKLHSAIALIDKNEKARDYLADELLTTHCTRFGKVARSLAGSLTQSSLEKYRDIALNAEYMSQRFRAGCALAVVSPDDRVWGDPAVSGLVAEQLISKPPLEFLEWMKVLRPASKHLISSLSAAYYDENLDSQRRSFAADCLGEYLELDPDRLFELVAGSGQDGKLFDSLFGRLLPHKERAVQFAENTLQSQAGNDAEQDELEKLAMQKANSALVLLKLESSELVWPLFKDSPDPRLRSYLIHTLSRNSEEVDDIAARLRKETDVGVKQALVLCLGTFELSERQQASFVELLLKTYREESDAGLHSAAEWVLTKWNKIDQIEKLDSELAQLGSEVEYDKDGEKAWYINSQGQTFSIIDATEFAMGSPDSEKGRRPEEAIHQRRINRRIAVATKEVTVAQWRLFFEDTKVWSPDNPQLNHQNEYCPMLAMTWYEAAQYCNWLSAQDGIPEDQHCYELNSQNQFGPGMRAKDRFWELSGYRLPTEGEWEFACRSGSTTSRHYGETDRLLPHYAWYRKNAKDRTEPVARLKPNRFGLFDIQGNVYEWCYDEYKFIEEKVRPTDVLGDWPPTVRVDRAQRRVIRGGAFNFDPNSVRSADRYAHLPSDRTFNMGFRPVRTLPDVAKNDTP